MKILHIIAGAEHGGAETFSLDAMKSLHEEGCEQYVLCRPFEHRIQALKDRNIEYLPLTFNRFKKLQEKKIIRKAIERFQPDLVHCWMNRAASFMPKNTNIPVLGWFGGYYDLKNYKNCDFYMGVTKGIVEHIIEKTGNPDRSFLVHTFGTLEKDPPVFRKDFDIPEDAKTVLLLSRMHWKKGVDTLLQAAQNLDDVYFLLAGDGPDLEKFKTLSRELDVQNRVRFLGWRNDRSALLNLADACVLPSRYEPFGTVIAESWYAGTPLVATKAAGAKQYVTHEYDGLLSEIDDVNALTENLKQALYNEPLRKELIQNGRKTYESLFSKDVVTKSLLSAYQNIIGTGIPETSYVRQELPRKSRVR
ncbi:MAG: glycosyltransferase family 4 protein [Alphaproteobacteria bacterium]|nr:glycosyltransferase family 4 protein [Alphaproteobacteria bacterium]